MITIVIATYNAGLEIADCLASIFKLAIEDLEVIVVDGDSSDTTIDEIKKFEHPGLKWISEKDKGIYDALNKGVEMASGEWIYFLGSDDRLLKGFNELLTKLKDPTSVYYGNSKPYYKSVPNDAYGLLQGEFSNYRLAKYCMNHQSIIYPRSAFDLYVYNLKYPVLADYAFNIRLWGNDKFIKKFYPMEIVSYNMSGFSAETKDTSFNKDKLRLIRKYMGLNIYLRLLFRAIKDKLKR
ncbi:glycosyltransferase involved in cell wall biosynthesis [Pedobacter sp. UYP24]